MRILFLILILSVQSIMSLAQTFYFKENYTINDRDKSIRLYSFENCENYSILTLELTALRNFRQTKFWTGFESQALYTDNGSAIADIEVERTCYVNGKRLDCGWGDKCIWSYVKEGEKAYIQLRYRRIPSGFDDYIRIKFQICYGYFTNKFRLKIPRENYSSIDSEISAKKIIDENNDGICGIYEYTKSDEKVACIKENDEYKIIYLSGNRNSWWYPGDIIAKFKINNTGILYKIIYYDDRKTSHYPKISFNDISMKIDCYYRTEEYLKIYPKNSPKITNPSNISKSTPNIYTKQWTGTGFALNKGYIITNNHVVDGAKSISVLGVNGNNIEYQAEVIAVDKNNDLALVKINDSRFTGFNSIPYAVSNRMCEVGEDVFVLGYPLTSYMGDEIKLTNGIISSRSGYQGDVSTYQMSAPVQPGNSGGPMFDNKGNIVGIVNAGIPGAENVGYAIKTSYLYNLVGSAVSTSIIPQTNRVTGTSLAEKVKSVKKYVFFIKCKS